MCMTFIHCSKIVLKDLLLIDMSQLLADLYDFCSRYSSLWIISEAGARRGCIEREPGCRCVVTWYAGRGERGGQPVT